jgi:WD repeat-containing protein 19
MLFDTYQKIRENKLQLPFDLDQRLMIIHSYIIVRRIVKAEDHENAAWLLNRFDEGGWRIFIFNCNFYY